MGDAEKKFTDGHQFFNNESMKFLKVGPVSHSHHDPSATTITHRHASPCIPSHKPNLATRPGRAPTCTRRAFPTNPRPIIAGTIRFGGPESGQIEIVRDGQKRRLQVSR